MDRLDRPPRPHPTIRQQESMTMTINLLLLPVFVLLGWAMQLAFSKRREPAYPLIGMLTCIVFVVASLIGAHAQETSRLARRLEAVEKTHQAEERLSPLVNEIYQNIHDLQDRA